MVRWILVFFTCLLVCTALPGQSVVITGRVTALQTHAPIALARVYVKGAKTTVATDAGGYYKLRLKHAAAYIGASCTGYKTMYIKANVTAKTQTIDFALTTADSTFKQLVALNVNQLNAIELVGKVVAHKSAHSKHKLRSYGYEAYTRIQMDLEEMSDRFKSRKFFGQFKFIFNNIDSNSQIKPFLPFFLSETVSDYYYRKNIGSREIIKASKISGLTDINISQFLGAPVGQADIYNKYIIILKREFLSPITETGMKSYQYYLEDSQVIDNRKIYLVRFAPIAPGPDMLEGEIWIADAVFAIQQITLIARKNSHLNLVNTITIHNEYTPVKDSVWMPVRESLRINFARSKTAPALVFRRDAFYKNFIVAASKPGIDSLFKTGRPDISVKDSAGVRSDRYWRAVRTTADPASHENPARVYHMIDTLAGLKATHNYINVLETVFQGFADFGPVSIGNLYDLAGINKPQGWNFKLALKTNSHLSKVIRMGGYAGYGLRDKKVRYGGEVLWLVKKSPQISFYSSYRYDVTPRVDAAWFLTPIEFVTTYGFRRVEDGSVIPIKLMDNREFIFRFNHEFKFGYSYAVAFKNQVLQPLGNFNFSYLTASDNTEPNTNINSFTNTEFSITQRFAWNERFVGNSFDRVSLGSKFPVLVLTYAFGAKRILGSQFAYQKITARVTDTRVLGPLGKLRWHVEAGKIFGTMPYLLLYSPDASETYISWWPGFNTIPQYQFTADRYVEAMIDHHLGGLLFDRIPGFNKLKWREVWSARMWWGDLTQANYTANYANLAQNPANTGLVKVQTAGHTPFTEMSAGIENIFGFFRLEAVWRVTHLDPNGTRFSFRYGNFGVRLGFEIQF